MLRTQNNIYFIKKTELTRCQSPEFEINRVRVTGKRQKKWRMEDEAPVIYGLEFQVKNMYLN